MKLLLLDVSHRLSRDVIQLSRKLGLKDVIITKPMENVDSIIVVADGRPDNEAVLLIAHVLDGKRTVALAFSDIKGTAVFRYVTSYIKYGYSKLCIVIDQERESLERIYSEFRNSVGNMLRACSRNDRLVKAEIVCMWRRAEVIVVINGVDHPAFCGKHAIEDHLLYAAEILKECSFKEVIDDTKAAFTKLFGSREKRFALYNKLLKNPWVIKKAFKQHIEGFRLL